MLIGLHFINNFISIISNQFDVIFTSGVHENYTKIKERLQAIWQIIPPQKKFYFDATKEN